MKLKHIGEGIKFTWTTKAAPFGYVVFAVVPCPTGIVERLNGISFKVLHHFPDIGVSEVCCTAEGGNKIWLVNDNTEVHGVE